MARAGFKEALMLTAALTAAPFATSCSGGSEKVADEASATTIIEPTIDTTVTSTTTEAPKSLGEATCGLLTNVQESLGPMGESTVKIYGGENSTTGEIEMFGEITYEGHEMREDALRLIDSISMGGATGVIEMTQANTDVIGATSTLRVAGEATDSFTLDMDPPIDEAYNDQQFDNLIALQDQARAEVDRALASC